MPMSRLDFLRFRLVRPDDPQVVFVGRNSATAQFFEKSAAIIKRADALVAVIGHPPALVFAIGEQLWEIAEERFFRAANAGGYFDIDRRRRRGAHPLILPNRDARWVFH